MRMNGRRVLRAINRRANRIPQRAVARVQKTYKESGVEKSVKDLQQTLRMPVWPGMRVTPKRYLNYQLVQYERSRGHTKLHGKPIVLTLEATNVCNLKCPFCFTGVGERTRERGMMPMDRYQRLMDELGDTAVLVEFYNWGEPLLNKNIFDMIRMASDKGAGTIISTNFSFPFDEERATKLIRSGLGMLGAGLDGASQETYEKYRATGDFDLAFGNLKLLAETKRKLGAKTPVIAWSFHAFDHNMHELDKARAIAEEIGVDFSASKGWIEGEEWDDKGTVGFPVRVSPERCRYLWTQAVINNDGMASPCANTFYIEEDFGQVDDGGFLSVWNNRHYQEARRTFNHPNSSEFGNSLICNDCPYTKNWGDFEAHLAQGHTKEEFQSKYTTNDWFNYFFQRRHNREQQEAPAGAIDLQPVEQARTSD